MKMIGLIGGTSYESMACYYKMINIKVNKLLGGYHSAKLAIINLDFNEIVPAFYANRWDKIEQIMLTASSQLEYLGVEAIAICCNTLHKVAPRIMKESSLPILHILDPIGKEINSRNISTIALLGTKFTMQDSFHKDYLLNHYKINSVVPNESDQEIINKIIFNELCFGVVKEDSKLIFTKIIQKLKEAGAQGIILGCTELFMLFSSNTFLEMPIFDTTALHVDAIVNFSLEEALSTFHPAKEQCIA